MFDLMKRRSRDVSGGLGAEEPRAAAVRRRVKGAAAAAEEEQREDRRTVSSGACDSSTWGPNSGAGAGEDAKRIPVKGSPVAPQGPPRPSDLHSPLRAEARSPATGKLLPHRVHGTPQDQSLNGGLEVHACPVSPALNSRGSPSPAREPGDRFLNGLSGTGISPATAPRGIQSLACSPILGSPSPSKRSIQSCNSLREGGHSPAMLSPRNRSPLAGKLRTPSPVQGRMRSYSPARNSWLGLPRVPGGKMEERERRAWKSSSVPDLIVYLEENRFPAENVERSPLKLLQSPTCKGSAAAAAKALLDQRLNHSISESCLIGSDKEHSPRQRVDASQGKDGTVLILKGADVRVEGGEIKKCGSEVSSQWNGAPSEDGRIHRHSECERCEKRKERRGDGPSDEEETEQKLYNIASELLLTERTYVARLHLLDQEFCSRLTEEAGRGSFPPEVIRNIFTNISSIYSFHSRFLLPDLENCISHWCHSPGLGDVLLQHAPFLRMYADYVRNFDQAMELVRTWTERSSAFRNIIQDVQSLEACGSLTLQHHMLEPVQRVPRYEMLLRDYLKKLPKDNPDYEVAQKSLQTISLAATHSNSAIHKAESLKRLLEIYEMVGEQEVINPASEFLREGRLLKLAARNTSSMERHLFLFNNFLLCCTPKFSLVGHRLAVRCRIGVDGMHVQQTTNEGHPYSFQVSGKERTLELQASSEQDRDEWIKIIQKAIDVYQKKNETFKLASKEPKVEEPAEELGRRAPRWTRDNEVTDCMKCQEPFNALTRRRHHCRACGCVVCWKCSDNKVALEYDGNRLNKVCKSCYPILIGRRGEKVEGKQRRPPELHVIEVQLEKLSRIQDQTNEEAPETPPESGDGVKSGFLLYGDNPKTWRQVWCVIGRSEPQALRVYAAPQAAKPLVCVPLPGCSVKDSPQELQGQPGFCLSQSRATHTFSCDSPDLRRSWVDALRVAATGETHSGCDATTNGSRCGGNVDDERVSSDEEFLVIDGKESHS